MEVDPQQYYAGAKVCNDLADAIHSALQENDVKLRTCASAAGSDETGKEWATKYNARLEEFYMLVYDSLIPALDNYSGILDQGGYNWALANYEARHDKSGHQPPAKPGIRPYNTRKLGLVHVVNGPGNGLKDGTIGLVNQIGIPVPDGDTDELQQVADAWKSLATQKSEALRGPLANLTKAFGTSNSPDAPDVVDDLLDLQSVVEEAIGMFTELGDMVQDQKNDVDHLRKELLVTALEALALEVGTKAVLSFASSFCTFGLAAAVGAAAIAASVAKWGPRIAKIIREWNDAKKLRQAAKQARDLKSASKKSDDIKDRSKTSTESRDKDSGTPGPKKPSGRYSGGVEKVNKADPDADKLAQRIGGESRVKFKNDPDGREFDVVSDQHIGQAKPANFTLNKSFRDQARATFEAAQDSGRKVYYHFDGPPGPGVTEKLKEYSSRYGVEVVIDTTPF